MDTPDTSAARVATAIADAGKTIKGTADAAGIPVTTFRRKLDGHTDFTVTELGRIAAALDVPPSSLLPMAFAE